MTDLPDISIRVHGGMSPSLCIELAKAADAAGFRSVWFAENAFARGILPAAAACAIATHRIEICAGVFNPFSRHPSMMAMEIGALDELSGGRACLSIGSGIASAAAKIGFNAEKPVPALRDTLAIVRGLLRGQEVDYVGAAFSARQIKLDYTPRGDIPIFLAGRGDLTAKLSGEAADGLIISNMCSAVFACRVAELVRTSRRAAGRGGAARVVQYVPCAVRSDPRQAIDAAKRAIAEMLPGFWALAQKLSTAKDALLAGTNITETEFARAATRLRAGDDPAEVLDERFARGFALFGTVEECLAGARHYMRAGVTELAITVTGPTAADEIRRLGEALRSSNRVQ